MNNRTAVPDAQVRRLAETRLDCNVVVVAGAGTGKTTLLVNRLIHLLMREPRPVEITQIVALTFTNKAATEMKVRLRNRLMTLASSSERGDGDADPGLVQAADLREHYGLSSDRIAELALAALHDLERAQIGTLHSFAAHLLRLYPIESGVDPGFEQDDGLRFEECVSSEWELWLDGELGPAGANHDRWRRLLAEVGLDQLRDLARELCSELVPLDELVRQCTEDRLIPALREWLAASGSRAAALLAAQDRLKRRRVEVLLAATRDLFDLLLERGLEGIEALPPEMREALDMNLGAAPAGWAEEAFTEAAGLIRVAKGVREVDPGFFQDLLAALAPFARQTRARFLGQGWISFDGLLARARSLLAGHPHIRERLKQECRAILVDEFQDTDPSQYEILLYLAERAGRCGATWRDVDLEPGKLFIVGDPKQSIYAFRRADIEAFDRVVSKIKNAGGEEYKLVTNFRSHDSLLAVANAFFDRLLREKEHVQPPNVPLVVRPDRQGGVTHPGVELRLVKGGEEEECDSAAATRMEAELLARWLRDELLAHEQLIDARGQPAPLRPGHVALLFRKLTQAQDYLEALHRHGTPYVTDGEKHFYRRQEVVDLVNLLRAAENPHDRIALAGILRSSLGGLTDLDLYELREREALDYRRADRLAAWTSPKAPVVRRLYERLLELSRAAPGRPLQEAVDLLWTRLPVLELAAASLHGEQAVANLTKVRQIAADLADRPHLTLSRFVELMIARLAEQPEEAESALAEESLDAVRVLTIHKAKGLEFPVVILPGLHHGAVSRGGGPLVSHDWSTGVLGLSLGGRSSLGALLVGEKLRVREEAERRRVFYVGMTRAKERLILSGGLPVRLSPGTFLSLLNEAAGCKVGQPEEEALHVGPATVGQTLLTSTERIPQNQRSPLAALQPGPEVTGWVRRWEERDRRWAALRESPRSLTPSSLMRQERGRRAGSSEGGMGQDQALLVGILAHRLLERWDFADDPKMMHERIQTLCRTEAPDAEAELQSLFTVFTTSEPYERLRRATILGREVPFAISWSADERHLSGSGPEVEPQVMEGVIDLIYRLDGLVWVADYKTDLVQDDEVTSRVTNYLPQARVYREAVSRGLGLERVGFQFIFLRNGRAVEV